MAIAMRPPHRPHWLLLLFLGPTLLSAAAPEIGAVWEGPPPELGKPLGRIQAGERTLYRWPTLEVTVVDGKIARIKRLDAEGQAAELAERKRLAAEESDKWAAERRVALRLEEARKAREREAAHTPAPAAPTAPIVPMVPNAPVETTPVQISTPVPTALAAPAPEPAPTPAPESTPTPALELTPAQAVIEPPSATALVVPSEPGITIQSAMPPALPAPEPVSTMDVSPPPPPDRTLPPPSAAVPPPSAAPAPAPTGKSLSIVRIPSDPVSQLERSIVILKLELARTDPREQRGQARLLEIEIQTKKAELDALRRAQTAAPPDSK